MAKKHKPVAIVYYRCELKGEKGKEYCTPHGGLYYVHNGVALEDLPDNNNRVRISHVAAWPDTNEVYIYQEKEAVDAAIKGKGKTSCCGSTEGTDQIWRPWAWIDIQDIHPYSEDYQPIAWMVDNNKKDPHNGALDRLEGSNGACTLHYWHYAHPKPWDKDENERTAKSREKFKHSPGSITVKGDLTIAPQPPAKLSPCP